MGGSFFLGSGSAGLQHAAGGQHQYHALAIQGTVLSLRINGAQLKNFDNQWQTFIAEGDVEAAKVLDGAIPVGDRLSTMLRGDFGSIKRTFVVGDRVSHSVYGVGTVTDIVVSPHGEKLSVRFGTRLEKVLAHTVQLQPTSK